MEHGESIATLRLCAVLVATTEEATRSIADQSSLRIETFPFRVGRERRAARSYFPRMREQRLGSAHQLNDLYLLELVRRHLQISREHFAIERTPDSFLLVDRGSACGTIVSGRHIGGDRAGGRIDLRSGSEIVVGTNSSPYVFRFEIQPN